MQGICSSPHARPPSEICDCRLCRTGNAGKRVKEFQAFERQAYKRLEILEAAPNKEALMFLPSNRFEALGGDRKGQYSIRINDRWRICFEWSEIEEQPFNIEIVDYH
jgi:proteic killer suppression protein